MTWTGLILTAALAAGQPPAADSPPAPAREADRAAPPAAAAEMAEDVEVMRRLLNKALGLPNDPAPQNVNQFGAWNPHYMGSTAVPLGNVFPGGANPNSPSHAGRVNELYTPLNTFRLADPFDGVYLKGHGVVYTLRVKAGEHYATEQLRRHAGLAAGCTACHTGLPVPAGKLEPQAKSQAEPTEWDRTRDDLRGVKPTAPAAPAPTVDPKDVCRPGRLVEAVMSALQKNGRHIRHLPGAEAVTVVVTLDGLSGPARAVTTADGNRAMADFLANDLLAPAGPQANTPPRPGGPQPMPGAAPPQPSGFTEEETKQITLGDLHARQNNPKGALAAYRKALARVRKPDGAVEFPLTLSQPVTEAQAGGYRDAARKAVEDVLKKLASAAIAAGDLDEAKKALDAVGKVQVVTAGAGREKPADPKAAALPVPAKLVLTVKKADLNDRLDPADFRKRVTVETIGLPPADRAKK